MIGPCQVAKKPSQGAREERTGEIFDFVSAFHGGASLVSLNQLLSRPGKRRFSPSQLAP